MLWNNRNSSIDDASYDSLLRLFWYGDLHGGGGGNATRAPVSTNQIPLARFSNMVYLQPCHPFDQSEIFIQALAYTWKQKLEIYISISTSQISSA